MKYLLILLSLTFLFTACGNRTCQECIDAVTKKYPTSKVIPVPGDGNTFLSVQKDNSVHMIGFCSGYTGRKIIYDTLVSEPGICKLEKKTDIDGLLEEYY